MNNVIYLPSETLEEWSVKLDTACRALKELKGGAGAVAWNNAKSVATEMHSVLRDALSVEDGPSDPSTSVENVNDSTVELAGRQTYPDRVGGSGGDKSVFCNAPSPQGSEIYRVAAKARKSAAAAYKAGKRRKRSRRRR